MASTAFYSLCHQNSFPLTHLSQNQTSTFPSFLFLNRLNQNTTRTEHNHHFSMKCTSNSAPEPVIISTTDSSFPSPETSSLNSPETFPIEKRRKSEILREKRSKTGLVKPEPPNFEVGWKRSKEISVEKPVGYVIMDFLEKLEVLIGRDYGSTELLVKAGEIVAERAREEAEDLRDEGKVEDRMVTAVQSLEIAGDGFGYGESCH